MEFETFKDCISTLKKYNRNNLIITKESLVISLDELEEEKVKLSNDVRISLLHYRVSKKNKDKQIKTIEGSVIPKLINLLNNQNDMVESNAKALTVRRITKMKNEKIQLEKIVTDNTNRMKYLAKKVLFAYNEIETLKAELVFIERCLRVYDFLTSVKMNSASINDSDLLNLYKSYLSGGNY